jgi:hypothetical protein
MGPNGSRDSEIRAVPAAADKEIKQNAKNYAVFVVR